MFGFFGKKKNKTADKFNLDKLIVRRSSTEAEEDWRLVQANVDFVNHCMDDGCLKPEEIPEKFFQSYHADYYLAQVNNGGNSQFVHNCHGTFEKTVENAANGLAAMGAHQHKAILDKLITWVGRYPSEAAAQTGFSGGRAEYLDQLDSAFYEVQRSNDMATLNAAWIRSWPELTVVEDDQYQNALMQIFGTHPNIVVRQQSKQVSRIDNQMKSNMWLEASTAISNGGLTGVVLGLGGGSMMECEGKQVMAFVANTTFGRIFIVPEDNQTTVFEYIEHDNSYYQDILNNPAEAAKRATSKDPVPEYKPPEFGKKLGTATKVECDQIRAAVPGKEASTALFCLLHHHLQNFDINGVAPVTSVLDLDKKRTSWFIVVNSKPFYYSFLETGAALREFDAPHDVIASIDNATISRQMEYLNAA